MRHCPDQVPQSNLASLSSRRLAAAAEFKHQSEHPIRGPFGRPKRRRDVKEAASKELRHKMTAIIDNVMLWRQFGAAIDDFGNACATARMNYGRSGCGKTNRISGSQPVSRPIGICATTRFSGWIST